MSRNSGERMSNISRMLRRNMTKEEKHLWYDFLKKLPLTVHRQMTMDNYIVDFYIPCVKLVIEVDGDQHYSDTGREEDALRDEHFARSGNMVLRFTNADVNSNFDGVCTCIISHIRERGLGEDWSPFKDE